MRVLILANSGMGLYKFRKELIDELIKNDNEVIVSFPSDSYVERLKLRGCKYVALSLNRRGKNLFEDILLLSTYYKLIGELEPDIILTYTIKPNIYGGLAARLKRTPYLANITGLGTTFQRRGLFLKLIVILYRLALKNSCCVFFQNTHNMEVFKHLGIDLKSIKLIPGSGVNINDFYPVENNENINLIRFLFVGRVMREKGVLEYLEVARQITKEHENVCFDIVGPIEENEIESLMSGLLGTQIQYHGISHEVKSHIDRATCLINPSYHEGMSNVLLEAGASGKPLIASNIPGCQEIIDHGESGYLFSVGSVEALSNAVKEFILLSPEKRLIMGNKSREKIVKEFDRNIVVKSYMEVINDIVGGIYEKT